LPSGTGSRVLLIQAPVVAHGGGSFADYSLVRVARSQQHFKSSLRGRKHAGNLGCRCGNEIYARIAPDRVVGQKGRGEGGEVGRDLRTRLVCFWTVP